MKRHTLGFTLIELIIVILIMSILGLGTVSFIRFSTQGYVDLAKRQSLAFLSYIATEK